MSETSFVHYRRFPGKAAAAWMSIQTCVCGEVVFKALGRSRPRSKSAWEMSSRSQPVSAKTWSLQASSYITVVPCTRWASSEILLHQHHSLRSRFIHRQLDMNWKEGDQSWRTRIEIVARYSITRMTSLAPKFLQAMLILINGAYTISVPCEVAALAHRSLIPSGYVPLVVNLVLQHFNLSKDNTHQTSSAVSLMRISD